MGYTNRRSHWMPLLTAKNRYLIVCIGGHKIRQRVDKLEKVGVGCTQTTPIATRFQSNRTPLGCVGTGDSHHGCVASNSTATM